MLRRNSWLYNYYAMQTKLQFGLTAPYENPVVPINNNNNKPSSATNTTTSNTTNITTTTTPPVYYDRTETMSPYQDDQYPFHHHHHLHHHHHHLHHNMLTSAYHLHQQQQQSPLHHYQHSTASGSPYQQQQLNVNNTDSSNNTTALPSSHRTSTRKRPTDSEPVDYSVHSAQDVSGRSRFLRVKKERIILPSPESPLSSDDIVGAGGTSELVGEETLLLSATSSFGRSRALVKAASTLVVDPADFIDQWNPSPPWSDTTMQKVPDLFYQDLSPHITTSPSNNSNAGVVPLPLTSSHHHHAPPYSAFPFDWTAAAQEQYVPNGHQQTGVSVSVSGATIAAARSVTSNSAATAVYLEDENYYPYSLSLPPFAWSPPTEQHRLITLQPPPPPRTPFLVKIESDSSNCSSSSYAHDSSNGQ